MSCYRSHPHEHMNAECQNLTEAARQQSVFYRFPEGTLFQRQGREIVAMLSGGQTVLADSAALPEGCGCPRRAFAEHLPGCAFKHGRSNDA